METYFLNIIMLIPCILRLRRLTLKNLLIHKNKTHWLDIGCGNNFEEGFYYLDQYKKSLVKKKYRSKYFQIDITNLDKNQRHKLSKNKKYDLIRLQHTLEHFTWEDGQKVIRNCATLLKKDSLILITVPDLKINIQKYLDKSYAEWNAFNWWAWTRIPRDAPDSFYFSIYTHSMAYQKHLWCYDFEGLKFQLQRSGKYKNIRLLDINHPLASIPFTHNRPEEDLCVIAERN